MLCSRTYLNAARARLGVGKCSAPALAAVDIEGSLTRLLEPVLGNQISRPVLQQSVQRVTCLASTRRVSVTMRDGSALEYVMARPNRAGVRSNLPASLGRVPRITRVLSLAIKLKQLLSDGVAGSNKEIAELGHISRARMSQIMRLTELAPEIQEELLFLPRNVRWAESIYESELRQVAREIDWEDQRTLFRAAIDSAATYRA
jgi:hypothetical protein